MKKIIMLLLAIISLVFITTKVYAEMPEITEDEMATLYAEAASQGVYLVGASPTTIRFIIPKDLQYTYSEAQRWNSIYESWQGISSPEREIYSSELYDIVTFSYLSPTYPIYRVYFDGIVVFVYTAEENTNVTIKNIAQDTTYTDKEGGLKVKWSDRFLSATKNHVVLKRAGSSKILFEEDINPDLTEYVFPTSFGNSYDIAIYPKYGEENEIYYEGNALELEEVKPYLSVNNIKVSIENKEFEWNNRQILSNDIKFEYETRAKETLELESSDFTYTPGSASVGSVHGVLTGKDHLLGSKNVNYKVVERNITDTTKNRTSEISDEKHTGYQIKPSIKIEFLPTSDGNWEELSENNYDIEYGENISGVGSVTITGKNNCKGKITKEFNIIGGGIVIPSDDEEEVPLEIKKPTASISAYNNTLIIDWDSQDSAVSYELQRSTDGKKYQKLATISSTTYSDKGLTYGKTYYYKVRAYDGKKYSSYSNIVNNKVVPNKVNNLKVTKVSYNSLTIAWDKVPVTGYEVYRSTDGKKWSKVTTIKKSSTLTFKNKSLKANKKYYYKVRAYKMVSGKKISGKYSDVVTIKTAPTTPKKPGISLNDYNALKISIKSVSGASKYEIVRSTSKKGTYTKVGQITSAGNYIDNNLTTGKTYYYKVRACNSNDNCGPYSSIVSKKVVPKTPGISLVSSETKKVMVTVKQVNGIDGYEVYRSTKKNSGYKKQGEITDLENLVLENKTSSKKTYYYKVRAYKLVNNKKVYSAYSSVKKIKSK